MIEEAKGPLLVLMRDGSTREIAEITGGGMAVGDRPDLAYEVHGLDKSGEPVTIPQCEVAAVLDLDSMNQVEFGNKLVASLLGHPRGVKTIGFPGESEMGYDT
jgi:hypothetical protein